MEERLSEDNDSIKIEDVKLVLLFYADDLVLFSDTPEGLQSQIEKLSIYCQRWKLSLNSNKSRIVVFKKGNRPLNFVWHFGDIELQVTNQIPYLSIIFSSNGSFHKAQSKLATQASKALFLLRRKMSQFTNIKPEMHMDIFDKFILPILNYGSEVWGFHPSPEVEKLHLAYCKRILGVKKSTQNDFVYGELARYPLQILRFCRIVKYWLLIVNGKKHYMSAFFIKTPFVRLNVINLGGRPV